MQADLTICHILIYHHTPLMIPLDASVHASLSVSFIICSRSHSRSRSRSSSLSTPPPSPRQVARPLTWKKNCRLLPSPPNPPPVMPDWASLRTRTFNLKYKSVA